MISPNNQANLQGVNKQGSFERTFFVNINGGGRASANNYPIAFGYEVFLLDEDSKMFFIKKNDGMGITLREFTYEEVTPEPASVQTTPTDFDPSKYATKEDLNVILEEIKKLQGRRDRGHYYDNTRPSRRSRNGKQYADE